MLLYLYFYILRKTETGAVLITRDDFESLFYPKLIVRPSSPHPTTTTPSQLHTWDFLPRFNKLSFKLLLSPTVLYLTFRKIRRVGKELRGGRAVHTSAKTGIGLDIPNLLRGFYLYQSGGVGVAVVVFSRTMHFSPWLRISFSFLRQLNLAFNRRLILTPARTNVTKIINSIQKVSNNLIFISVSKVRQSLYNVHNKRIRIL